MKRKAVKRAVLFALVCALSLPFCVPAVAGELEVSNYKAETNGNINTGDSKDGEIIFDNEEDANKNNIIIDNNKDDGKDNIITDNNNINAKIFTNNKNSSNAAEPCEDGHTWNEDYTVDKQPVGDEPGIKSIHCTVCDIVKEGSEIEFYSDGWHKINGAYYFYKDNETQKGWVSNIGRWYYTDIKTGKMLTGWQKIDGSWYYFKPGDSGKMLTGWQKINGSWFFLKTVDGKAKAVTGWQKIGNYYYYFKTGDSGRLLTGWQKIDGSWYYLRGGDSGRMLTGWQYIDGSWFFLYSNGKMASGWCKVGSSWYYFKGGNSGRMLTGWINVNGGWYYLESDGKMQTGWLKYKNHWYYLKTGDSGRMYTGWNTIDGNRLYFGTDGICTNFNQLSPTSKMKAMAQYYLSKTQWLMMVDLTNNITGVYKGSKGNWSEVYSWPCTTGTAEEPTVLGEFEINSNRGYSFGSDHYTCYYYSSFYGPYLFHSGLYYPGPERIPQDIRLGIRASAGCIRLEINNAKWVLDNIPLGTKVVTYY